MDEKKVRISSSQFFVLFFIITVVDSKVQGLMLGELKQDYLISIVIGFILSFGIVTLYWLLAKRTNFIDGKKVFENLLGKFLGKIVLAIYGIYFLFLASIDLRDITEMVREYYIPLAPIQFLSMPLMIVIIYASLKGIEVIARSGRYIFIIVMVILPIFLVLILLLNEVHVDHLIPLFQNDFKDILFKGIQVSYSVPFGVAFVLFFIIPLVSDKKNLLKNTYMSHILSGVVLIFSIVISFLVINPAIMPASLSPTLMITRRIDAPNFIQRLDLITLGIYVLSSTMKNSILLYVAYSCYKDIIKQREILYLIFGVLVLTVANTIFIEYPRFINFDMKYVTKYIHLTFEFFIPVVLLLLTFIVKRKEPRPQNNQ